MPLRDHFHPPLERRRHWQGFHGAWPAMIVLALAPKLPRRYVAEPRVQLSGSAEIDVGTFDEDEASSSSSNVPTSISALPPSCTRGSAT